MKKILYIIVFLNALRLITLPLMGVVDFDMSLVDPSTLIGQIQLLFIKLLGENTLALKLPNFLLVLFSQFAFYFLCSQIIRTKKRMIVLLLFSTTFMLTKLSYSTGSMPLLILLWILSVDFYYRAILCQQHSYFIYAGLTLGLAFSTHYVSIFIPVGIFLFLIFSTRYRVYFTRIHPYIALAIALIIGTTAYFLDVSNGLFGLEAGQDIYSNTLTRFSINNTVKLIGYQAFILMPVLYVGMWWILFKYSGRIFEKPNQINPELWYLLSLFLPMYIGFYMIAFFHFIPINWLLPAYITGIIFYGKFITKRWIYVNYAMILLVHALAYWHLFNKNFLFETVEFWIK